MIAVSLFGYVFALAFFLGLFVVGIAGWHVTHVDLRGRCKRRAIRSLLACVGPVLGGFGCYVLLGDILIDGNPHPAVLALNFLFGIAGIVALAMRPFRRRPMEYVPRPKGLQWQRK